MRLSTKTIRIEVLPQNVDAQVTKVELISRNHSLTTCRQSCRLQALASIAAEHKAMLQRTDELPAKVGMSIQTYAAQKLKQVERAAIWRAYVIKMRISRWQQTP